MRVRVSKSSLRELFDRIIKEGRTTKNVASRLNVSIRTLNDWENGVATIPRGTFRKLTKIAGIEQEDCYYKLLPDFWHIKDAATKGAYKRMEIYGNPGTPEGRRKGGFASIKVNRRRLTNFKTLKLIKKPKQSEKLAELMGILFGDGHLSKYQISVTTNSKTDRQHALFVRDLMRELFGVSVSTRIKDGENAINVTASSKSMVLFLQQKGIPIGDKIKNHLSVPSWIFKRTDYQKAFIRGLFDTDGCIYIDVHKTNKKTYKHLGWTITSYAKRLRLDIINILSDLGFSPTHRPSQKSVYIRKQREIAKYFSEIKTNNQKHHRRYTRFI